MIVHIRPPKIHWRKFIERKVLILTVVVVVSPYLGQHLHFMLIDRLHELALGTLTEHLLFGIPLEDA